MELEDLFEDDFGHEDSEASSQPLSWRLDPAVSLSDWIIEVRETGSSSRKAAVYHCHRSILSVGPRACKYFTRLFAPSSRHFSEASTSTTQLTLHDTAAEAFPVFLDFIYGGLLNIETNLHGFNCDDIDAGGNDDPRSSKDGKLVQSNEKILPKDRQQPWTNAVALLHLAHYLRCEAAYIEVTAYIKDDLKLIEHAPLYFEEGSKYCLDRLLRATCTICARKFDHIPREMLLFLSSSRFIQVTSSPALEATSLSFSRIVAHYLEELDFKETSLSSAETFALQIDSGEEVKVTGQQEHEQTHRHKHRAEKLRWRQRRQERRRQRHDLSTSNASLVVALTSSSVMPVIAPEVALSLLRQGIKFGVDTLPNPPKLHVVSSSLPSSSPPPPSVPLFQSISNDGTDKSGELEEKMTERSADSPEADSPVVDGAGITGIAEKQLPDAETQPIALSEGTTLRDRCVRAAAVSADRETFSLEVLKEFPADVTIGILSGALSREQRRRDDIAERYFKLDPTIEELHPNWPDY